ncbi:hypothetical protein L5515_015013 [Caenorhabditis briggsae]|uniref:Uncharacterized protein n=1 Tax=Caenorhabditis briggsae TaxID=6238 RepID=A0AAE9J7M2_CAEBR|nr:hypothetical protein L5515_015013 [Caenorhabditis briggsae]
MQKPKVPQRQLPIPKINYDLSRAPSSEPFEGPPPPTTRPPPTPDPESSSPTKSPPRKLPFLNTQSLRKRGRPKAISASETHVNALLIRVAALEARIERQDKKIASLEATIKTAETISGNNYDPPLGVGPPKLKTKQVSCALYADVLRGSPLASKVSSQLELAANLKKLEQKSHIAVIENYPDTKVDDQQGIDKLFIENIIEHFPADLPKPKPTDNFRVKCRNTETYARPLKVRFSSQTDRDSFIHNFSKSMRSIPNFSPTPRPIRCRRDMTTEELAVLRELWKKAFEANAQAGVIKYFVKRSKNVPRIQ